MQSLTTAALLQAALIMLADAQVPVSRTFCRPGGKSVTQPTCLNVPAAQLTCGGAAASVTLPMCMSVCYAHYGFI
jgi:hypothetical protein